jgi:hypothetical protein
MHKESRTNKLSSTNEAILMVNSKKCRKKKRLTKMRETNGKSPHNRNNCKVLSIIK